MLCHIARRSFAVRRPLPADPFRSLVSDVLEPLESPFRSLFPTAFPSAPRVHADVHETPSEYVIEAEVPGIPRSNLSIDLSDADRCLSIQGNIESETKSEGAQKTWISERLRGQFRRTFHFEDAVKGEGVTAELKDGVLRVVVPKAEDSRPTGRKIEISE